MGGAGGAEGAGEQETGLAESHKVCRRARGCELGVGLTSPRLPGTFSASPPPPPPHFPFGELPAGGRGYGGGGESSGNRRREEEIRGQTRRAGEGGWRWAEAWGFFPARETPVWLGGMGLSPEERTPG